MLRTFFVAVHRTLRFWENFGVSGGFLTPLAIFCYHHVLRFDMESIKINKYMDWFERYQEVISQHS